MGLGLLILTAVGKENIYLNIEPEITFFKKNYKRYTNFSIEAIPQYFKTTPDFGKKCSVIISKNADLMSSSYLYVELPNLFSDKYIKWVDKIGLALINYIEIEIEGNIIDKHYGEWLNIWHELTITKNHRKSYDAMIGNIPMLTSYSYKKASYKLYIPLCFWFCNHTNLSLPLISLTNSDIIINVVFNNFDYCYNIKPSHYITINEYICCFTENEIITQIFQNKEITSMFVSFDPIMQRLYYNPIKDSFNIPQSIDEIQLKQIIGTVSNLIVTIQINSNIVTNTDTLIYNKPSLLNAYLLINYIYLDNYERLQFINNDHEYIIPIIQTLPEQMMYSLNNTYKLPLTNLITLLVWRCILKYNNTINIHFNYNNNIITNTTIVINSINRMDLTDINYYSLIQQYQYKFNYVNNIYMYSFALYPKYSYPSGSLNFSKVNDAYLHITINNSINYQNPISFRCYAIQYNILYISKGIAGLKFIL